MLIGFALIGYLRLLANHSHHESEEGIHDHDHNHHH